MNDDEALIATLSEAARRMAAEDPSRPGPLPSAWNRLQAARMGARRRRWTWPMLTLAGLGALGAVISAAISAAMLRRPPPLTYVVNGGQIESNGYLRSAGNTSTELQFSDGTRVRLNRGARLSVGTPGRHGARLRVEDGAVHFEVTHRPGADWSVEAGPYHVQVTGTVFDVGWAADTEAAVVRLHTGAVRVTGPHLASPVTLEAGQRLVATLATGEVRLEGDDPPAKASASAATSAPEPAIVTPPSPSAPLPPPSLPTSGGAPEDPRAARDAVAAVVRPAVKSSRPPPPAVAPSQWAARVTRGEAAAVVAEVRSGSVETVLASVDGPALAALADAARYMGDRALSQRALVALRHRFSGSALAPAAAFLLGRMADDQGDPGAALSFYRSYRAEAPAGPYAAEALGREMLAVERLSGRPAAAAIARDYLDHFPEGTYLLQARAILGLP